MLAGVAILATAPRPGPTSASPGRFGGSGTQCVRRGRLLLSAPLYLLGGRRRGRGKKPKEGKGEAKK
ncbi:hypothetical protein CNMCM6805_000526 [Aspergillus fumigatiaffinis]|uniref:Uncharacterized protein n=1 Tax=Aspergillus fumigatiaffinis TaxID=340414 RepID=A0A8H4M5R0_9EURO|nr:hypothetical protein CNMCM6457_000578 [Aspergillus fumigatiaffinis]KAF4230835.1 hypothetical protein CNMCM6805_000526 [Aspergillus fumigatiaffinis]